MTSTVPLPLRSDRPKALVLDASYTLEMIVQQGMENSVTCRDLDGYFSHVWSTHPFASMLTSEEWATRFGKPVWTELTERHTFIEGKVGRWKWLERFYLLNFIAAQLGLFVRLWRLIRREKIAFIRVGDPLYLGLFGLALARLTGIPLMIRVNGNNDKVRENTGAPLYPRLFRSERVERWIERRIFPRCAMVAAPNPDNIAFAVSAGARPEVTTIFRYGNLLAVEHLQLPAERGLDKKLFDRLELVPSQFLLSIGRLQPTKFPEDCVYVLTELRKRGHEIKLLFAGDGELKQALWTQAEASNVSQFVVFGGNQNQAALAQLNAHAAVVLSPLTGRALSESALGGAAIVAYDLDWQGELIESGKTGSLVPFRERDQFVDATEQFLNDRALRKAMGAAVRERAMQMLDPDLLDEHERAEYRRILNIG